MTETPATILLVEDDPALSMGLVDSLEFEGFRVLHTDRGETGAQLALSASPDCLILDLMLPDINGYEVCQRVRRRNGQLPILMLTARSLEADKIRGFNAGADDYVSKPFSVGELVARVRALIRRAARATTPAARFIVGEAVVDAASHTLERDGQVLPLTFYEVQLLQLLYDRRGQPVSRDEILDRVWDLKATPTNRTVDNFVAKLRKKLEQQPERPRHILTVHGLGYKLVV